MHDTTATSQAYGELQQAYNFFNKKLFNGELPHCLITLQRKNKARGYFCGERFGSDDNRVVDEIAMNPVHFNGRTPIEILSTLAHEMTHLWQAHFGKPSRSAYHNSEWAWKMEQIGLMPSDTGLVGGKRTGQRVTHYIIESGIYQVAAKELLATGLKITWKDRANELKKPSAARTKYHCDMCNSNVWGKGGLAIMCMACDNEMQEL
jgi:predicted SprT family Zn-dependent metalloprotease